MKHSISTPFFVLFWTIGVCFLYSCNNNTPKNSDPTGVFIKKNFQKDGHAMPYQILLPKNFNRKKSYPLLLFLHGAGERGTNNELQLVHGSKMFLEKNNQEKYPAIVVFPQCPRNSYWSNVKGERVDDAYKFTFYEGGEPTVAMKAVQALLTDLKNTYKIDAKRMYVGGLSMGGMGTFELVYRNPKTFAAAFAICGGANTATASKITDTQWWVFHGEDDRVVNHQHSLDMVKALKDVGGNVKFSSYPEVNHNSWDSAFAEPDFLSWIFSHKMK